MHLAPCRPPDRYQTRKRATQTEISAGSPRVCCRSFRVPPKNRAHKMVKLRENNGRRPVRRTEPRRRTKTNQRACYVTDERKCIHRSALHIFRIPLALIFISESANSDVSINPLFCAALHGRADAIPPNAKSMIPFVISGSFFALFSHAAKLFHGSIERWSAFRTSSPFAALAQSLHVALTA